MNSPEARVKALGIELPALSAPAANYTPIVRSGRLAFVSGQGPIRNGVVVYKGVIGADLSEEAGYDAARLAVLNALAVLRAALGTLDAISRVVKLLAWVRSAPGFERQHVVANGASDLLVDIFGESGRHARSAVSAPELPFGIAVELELVVETN
ncbi:RidA family protein [Burkholderia pyrrocinia]|uniref:RidA family protein n=1 Tax=Burkholderia pyrrocinia TaxID=60550 RepID=UPI002AB12958|nr:RidA family protein [Burkholderia pyrrocinia]